MPTSLVVLLSFALMAPVRCDIILISKPGFVLTKPAYYTRFHQGGEQISTMNLDINTQKWHMANTQTERTETELLHQHFVATSSVNTDMRKK